MTIRTNPRSKLLRPRDDAMTVLERLGLTKGLKICLDAGSFDSYNPGVSTDKWLDLSGNGEDFFRGTVTGADAADPTFNGTAGSQSQNEYWSFDGADWFELETANPAYVNAWHYFGAKYSFAVWCYYVAVIQFGIFGTSGATQARGISFFASDSLSNSVTLRSVNDALGNSMIINCNTVNASAVFVPSQPNFFCYSVDEAGGASGSMFNTNGFTGVFNGAYTSPSSGAAGFTMEIGARGGGWTPVPNTARIYSFMAWDQTVLTIGQSQALFNATRGKFGV